MISVVEQNEKEPICPFCSSQINTLYVRLISSIFGKRYIYYCSNCLKVLGISHRKGFWMG